VTYQSFFLFKNLFYFILFKTETRVGEDEEDVQQREPIVFSFGLENCNLREERSNASRRHRTEK